MSKAPYKSSYLWFIPNVSKAPHRSSYLWVIPHVSESCHDKLTTFPPPSVTKNVYPILAQLSSPPPQPLPHPPGPRWTQIKASKARGVAASPVSHGTPSVTSTTFTEKLLGITTITPITTIKTCIQWL